MYRSSSAVPARAMTPRAARQAAAFTVAVRGPTTPRYECAVRNVSSSGLLLDDAAGLSVGDAIFVDLPELGAVLCTVVRLRGGAAGVKFVTPIKVAVLPRA
jgi:hypothetical protein